MIMEEIMRKTFFAIFAAQIFAGFLFCENFTWKREAAELHGLPSDIGERLHKILDSTEDIHAWAFAKDGIIIEDFYRAPYDSSARFPIHSCSKSITGTLVAIAIEQGKIKGLDQLVSDYFPDATAAQKQTLKNITIRHLLNNTSGIAVSDAPNWTEWRGSENWVEWILNRPAPNYPGQVFSYATQNTHLLSYILQKATGEKLFDYAKENLFDKIGMKSATLSSDAQGIGDGGNGFVLTVEDMLRFGQLYLNGGKWQGEQVVPEYWTREAGVAHIKRNVGTANYGWQFWARNFNGADTFFAWGYAGQFIFIIPSKNIVFAFTSNHTGNIAVYFNAVRAVIDAR